MGRKFTVDGQDLGRMIERSEKEEEVREELAHACRLVLEAFRADLPYSGQGQALLAAKKALEKYEESGL